MKISWLNRYIFSISCVMLTKPGEYDSIQMQESCEILDSSDINIYPAKRQFIDASITNFKDTNLGHGSINLPENFAPSNYYPLNDFSALRILSDYSPIDSLWNEDNSTIEQEATYQNAKIPNPNVSLGLDYQEYDIPKFMCLTSDDMEGLLPETYPSSIPENISVIPCPEETNKTIFSEEMESVIEIHDVSTSDFSTKNSSMALECNETKHIGLEEEKELLKPETIGQGFLSEKFSHNSSDGSTVETNPRLGSVCLLNFISITTYAELFKSEVSAHFTESEKKDRCFNYEYFLKMIPNLYSEIDDSLQKKNSNENTLTENNEVILTHENYRDVISNEISKYKAVFQTDIIPREILIFANKLINFEKKYSSDLKFIEIKDFPHNITQIMEKIRGHKNLVIFYELLKFVHYYKENPCDYIENNYCLYVHFFLSIISEQLDNFDDSFSLKLKNCPGIRKKCKNESNKNYFQKLFIQKLFSKLLLGMKNGEMKLRFYFFYLSHELIAGTRHGISENYKNNLTYFNQTKIFKFYLRIFISIVLNCHFESKIEILNDFINFSFDIFKRNKFLKNEFTEKLKSLMKNSGIRISSLIEIDLKIIEELDIEEIGSEYIKNFISNLKKKLEPFEILSINNIFMSEICLSCYFKTKYRDHKFAKDENYTSWQNIYKCLKSVNDYE